MASPDIPTSDLPAFAAPDIPGPVPAADDGDAQTSVSKPDSTPIEQFGTPLGSSLPNGSGAGQRTAPLRPGSQESLSIPDMAEKSHELAPTEQHQHTAANAKDLEAGVGAEDGRRERKEGEGEKSERDPNIVDFDGPDDPIKAVNWPASKKWALVAPLSAITFITPLASSMFAPAVPEVVQDFNNHNIVLSSFVVSVYILGYAAGPIFIAPLSELYGRRVMYDMTNLFFVIFTIACAVSTNLNMLIGFRFLEGLAGSGCLTMGGGTLADLFVQQERGRAMAIWASGPLLGPVIGPVVGGFLAQAEGWQWVFWVIAIAGGVIGIGMFIFNKETYAPIILQHKVNRLRKETGNPNLRSAMDSGLSPRAAFAKAIVRPTKMLIYQPIVLGLSTYNAVVYGYLYLLFTTITEVFEQDYQFSQGVVGLTFLGIGVGMLLSLAIFGIVSDATIKSRHAKGLETKPEYRLPPMIATSFLIPMGLFIYGWSAQYKVFWFVPIFGTSFVGFGLIATFMSIQTYLVDAFTLLAASAIAANTILRSLLGALLPLAGPSMYARLGLGWGNSLLGFIAVALIPIPWVFFKYGERIRNKYQVDL